MNTSANTKRSLTIGISDPPKKEARISGLSFIVSDGHAFTGSRTPSDFVGLRFAHGNYHENENRKKIPERSRVDQEYCAGQKDVLAYLSAELWQPVLYFPDRKQTYGGR